MHVQSKQAGKEGWTSKDRHPFEAIIAPLHTLPRLGKPEEDLAVHRIGSAGDAQVTLGPSRSTMASLCVSDIASWRPRRP